MLQPGLEPAECPNYTTCGRASQLTPDEEVELVRVRQVQREYQERRRRRVQQEYEQRQEVWRTTRREVALEMLMRRGCPQSIQRYISTDTFEQLAGAIAQLQEQLTQMEEAYIPPEGCIVHRYWVNRGYARYPYNKLMAPNPVFPAVEQEQRERTRVIHLSNDDDLRNLEARKGITRMYRLIEIRAQLQVALAAIGEAIALAQLEIEPYWAEGGERSPVQELETEVEFVSFSEATTDLQ